MLYEDETIVWRFALPRLGWWRRAQRYRLPTRPLSQGQIKQQESHKRQTWVADTARGAASLRGVLLRVYRRGPIWHLQNLSINRPAL